MSGASAPAIARKEICSRTEGEFGAAILGELKELVKASRRKHGAGHNLCDYEHHLAQDLVDAIVLIPASEGSFAELGLFSLNEEICKKTLLLLDHDHSRAQSFINLGGIGGHSRRRITQRNVQVRA